MDAHALLSSQGWRGTGHSLHKTDDSIGLAKPLLLNRKDNTKGLGVKQHFTSDQWWMNAFDEQLKGLDTTKKGEVKQTITAGKLNAIEKGSLGKYALYTSFVRGGLLEGTLEGTPDTESSSSDSGEEQNEKSALRMTEPKVSKEPKEDRRARKAAKRQRREARALAKAARLQQKDKSKRVKLHKDTDLDKEKRRAKKEAKRRERDLEGKKKKP